MTSLPKVSIVIAVGPWNDFLKESIRRCQELEYPDYEIIVLPDDLPDQLPDGVQVIPTGRKSSPGYKRDLGAEHSKGSIIAFLDDDAYPAKGWLTAAVSVFLSDGSIGAVGGPAVTPPHDSLSQHASGLIYSSLLVGGNYRFRYIPQIQRDVDDYPTCNLLVRKDVFNAVSGFDTNFYPGEDTKLCLDITKKLGKRIVYHPDVLVYHHRRRMYKPHLRQVLNYGLHRGHFVKRFPETSFRLSYFLPSMWSLGVVSGWIVYFVHPWLFYFYTGVIVFYLLIAVLTSIKEGCLAVVAKSFWDRIKLTYWIFTGLAATHFVYGLWFMKGLVIKNLPEEQSIRN